MNKAFGKVIDRSFTPASHSSKQVSDSQRVKREPTKNIHMLISPFYQNLDNLDKFAVN